MQHLHYSRVANVAVAVGLRVLIEKVGHHPSTACDREQLLWMVDQIELHCETWPIDKLARWLGFVQGVLACAGYIQVDEERDRTRSIFHAAYEADGLSIPESTRRER